MTRSMAYFFVNPSKEYSDFIEPLPRCPTGFDDCTVDNYKRTAGFWVSSFAGCAENIFLVLTLSIKLLEWVEI